MQVLVIGGTGFIGPHVAHALVARGHPVTVFHRGQSNSNFLPRVNHIYGDRRDLPTFREEFKRLAPRVVLDMVCFNEREARDLMQTFKGIAARVVTPSSGDVYQAYGRLMRLETGTPETASINEDSPLRESRYPYRAMALSREDFAATYDKIPVEQVVMNDSGLPSTILRLPSVYGLGDPHHRLFEYLKRIADGRKAILLEENHARWRWTRGYVENVADAIALAITDERAAGKIYNVGEDCAFSEAEWARKVCDGAGWNGEIVAMHEDLLPQHLAAPYDFAHHMDVDTNRMREELGYRERVAHEVAIKETISWERANPPEQIDSERFNYAAEDAALAEAERRGK